ncbi:MAG: hypothetical protein WCS37_13805 [Chloroflexota bacterium]|nr:hypothetical protein [Chloroflexota bacterium]
MKLQAIDTSFDIEQKQMELLRQAGPERRANLMRNWTTSVRRMSRYGLRKLHPDLSEPELDLLFLKHLYNLELDQTTAAKLNICRTSDKGENLMNEDIIAAIEPVVAAFEKLKVAYLIGGSVATSILGLPRSTIDADLVADLRLEHVPLLVAALEQDYYLTTSAIEEAIARKSSFNVLHLVTMSKVDIFILKTNPFDLLAFSRRQPSRVDTANPKEYFLSSPEDILLHKLMWYEAGKRVSERQWLDVIGLLKVRGHTLDRTYLEEWAERLGITTLLREALTNGGI